MELLKFDNDRPFATGRVPCVYRETGIHIHKLFVQVRIEGQEVEAMIDTGSAFFVCSPEYAQYVIGIQPGKGEGYDKLKIQGIIFRGELHRVVLKIEPEQGNGTAEELQITAFVPREKRASGYIGTNLKGEQEGWVPVDEDTFPDNFPCFLGLYRCLEQLRFAVDLNLYNPEDNYFYFGVGNTT